MMSDENLWIINPRPVKHLLQFINLWEKLWSYLHLNSHMTTGVLLQSSLKGGSRRDGNAHTEHNSAAVKELKQRLGEEPQPDRHEDRNRRRRHHRTGPRVDIRGCPR